MAEPGHRQPANSEEHDCTSNRDAGAATRTTKIQTPENAVARPSRTSSARRERSGPRAPPAKRYGRGGDAAAGNGGEQGELQLQS